MTTEMDVVDRETFVSRLNQHISKAGLTQKQLEELTGVTQATISRWTRGEGDGSWPEVARIAIALGLSPNDLQLKNSDRVQYETLQRTTNPEMLDTLPPDQVLRLIKVLSIFETAAPGHLATIVKSLEDQAAVLGLMKSTDGDATASTVKRYGAAHTFKRRAKLDKLPLGGGE